ncbi:hypothetical protein DNH61_04800 [Paenibacillus sambharensis]|uniref:Uncharacterized protein n=2 Tax=Paenibacillus sambharensis TaxID=1803190 RepID=A0A2W1LE80_9BACL|nr:hypothetical protein DNH61_04800 [Paenibacillus sambharensis]
MKSELNINQVIDHLHYCVNEEGGIIDFPWCSELLYPFYLHFGDPNERFRSGSLLAFFGLLCEWEDGSGFPFCTGIEEYECHNFECYMDHFIELMDRTKRDYPSIYTTTISSLKNLIYHNDLIGTFKNISMDKRLQYKKFVEDEYAEHDKMVYFMALKEAGIDLQA